MDPQAYKSYMLDGRTPAGKVGGVLYEHWIIFF